MFDNIIGILLPIVGGALIPLIGLVYATFQTRHRTVRLGYAIMSVIDLFITQKLGIRKLPAGTIEVIQEKKITTLDDLTFGMRLFLQGKPKPTIEELEERERNVS